MTGMEPDSAPDRPAVTSPADPDRGPGPAVQSREDTDAGWGDHPEPADERLRREMPPHWEPA
jgi:hypothetical protein